MSNADAEVSKTMDIQAETEEGVTMVDVLEEEEALEDDCAAVLGSVSDSSCTYSLGYLPRQPLYACKECTKDDGDKEGRAGFCLACSYHCHEVKLIYSYNIQGVPKKMLLLSSFEFLTLGGVFIGVTNNSKNFGNKKM